MPSLKFSPQPARNPQVALLASRLGFQSIQFDHQAVWARSPRAGEQASSTNQLEHTLGQAKLGRPLKMQSEAGQQLVVAEQLGSPGPKASAGGADQREQARELPAGEQQPIRKRPRFNVKYVGNTLLHKNFTLPMLEWIVKDIKRQEAAGVENPAPTPESRLYFAMLGGAFAVPISLFWMGWTDYSSISIWSPIISSALFGYGVITIFISAYMYVIDSYAVYAASALSFVTFTRYLAAGGMTVVGVPWYRNLGVHHTLTILACISALMAPVPFVFYYYGAKIRTKSAYAVHKA